MEPSPFRRRWASFVSCCEVIAHHRVVVTGSCLGALLLLGALGSLIRLVISQERLSVVGRWVANTSAWSGSNDGYYWESDTTQILLQSLNSVPSAVLRLDDRSGRTSPAVALSPEQATVEWTNRGLSPSFNGRGLLSTLGKKAALPSRSDVQEMKRSPDGRRIAYLTSEDNSSGITRFFARFFPHHEGDGKRDIALWVSDADGSGLRRIGIERVATAAELQWSPDSKRLSLFLNTDFYIVPAD